MISGIKFPSGKVPSEQTPSGFWGWNPIYKKVVVAWSMGPGGRMRGGVDGHGELGR
jgi:hypothetical protein